ncbi:hypothetical protein LPJ73_000336 [Coemansia sp. RSA 2703]|nr:hypothetical protein LPJ73_000336 [Coemansia sp. RSA 2703]KAJ2369191.1 hypothetical protein IW150_005213 [Coemansia sp. RSA 2607]KAJ2394151.1 hypothetical protein GGI05_002168 [Coemansia sp. RSA 2603]
MSSQPFIHIVLLAVKPDAPEALVNEVVSELNALSQHIPFVASSRCGKTVTQRGKQYTHGLVVELQSGDLLQAYADHPVHQAVLAKIGQITSEPSIAIDF